MLSQPLIAPIVEEESQEAGSSNAESSEDDQIYEDLTRR